MRSTRFQAHVQQISEPDTADQSHLSNHSPAHTPSKLIGPFAVTSPESAMTVGAPLRSLRHGGKVNSRLPAGLLLLLVAAIVVSSAGSNPVYGRTPEIPCERCDTQAIPDVVFARRYLGTCMECGIMYGTGIEHCCVCHENFTEQCRTALKKR